MCTQTLTENEQTDVCNCLQYGYLCISGYQGKGEAMSTGNRTLVTFKQEIHELLTASEDLGADF